MLYLVDFSEELIDILVFMPFPKKFFSSKPIAKEVFSNGLLTNANKDYHQEQLHNLQNIAKEIDLTLEQISYLWVYQLPFIKIILTGASTISQLQENLNCLNKLNTTIPNLDNLNLSVDDYWSTRKSLSWN